MRHDDCGPEGHYFYCDDCGPEMRRSRGETTMTTLKALIEDCIAEARRQGWDGEGQYELTGPDCDWIISHLGRNPTREEWAAAGYRRNGDASQDA